MTAHALPFATWFPYVSGVVVGWIAARHFYTKT